MYTLVCGPVLGLSSRNTDKPKRKRVGMVIYMLVKVFSEQDHADRFLRGELYARRLSWFKNLEGDEERGDEQEAAAVLPRDGTTVSMETVVDGKLQEVKIGKDAITSPIVMNLNYFDHLNLFCMCAFQSDDFEPVSYDSAEGQVQQLKLPEGFFKFGKYAVVIKDVDEFFCRVAKASRQSNFQVFRRLVAYYDPEIGNPLLPDDFRIVFAKRKEFVHQREYRIAIDTGTTGHEPVTFNIGRIEDIAFCLDTAMLRHMRWKLRGS